MKRFRFTHFILTITIGLLAPLVSSGQSTTTWTKSAGSAELDWGGQAVTDKEGNTYVFNSFTSEVDFSNNTKLSSKGKEDMFLMMLNAEGKIQWTKQFGSDSKDIGNDIAIDKEGNLMLVGSFSGTVDFGNNQSLTSDGGTDAFFVKLNKMGETMWALQAGGSGDDEATVVEIDSKGTIYTAGNYESTDGFFGLSPMISFGGEDMFVARMDADGKNAWFTNLGKNDNEKVEDLAIDAEGNMYVNGSFDGELVLGNDTISAELGATFTAKISAEGTLEWADQPGDETAMLDGGVLIDAEGNIYTVGSFEGTSTFGSQELTSKGKEDMVIVKQNAEGKVLWATQAGGTAEDKATCVAFDQVGNLVVGGYFTGEAAFGSTTEMSSGAADNVVTKIDAEGNVKWVITSGGSLNDKVESIQVASNGDIVATGTFEGTSTFKREESSNGKSDMYVWRIEGEPTNVNTPRTNEANFTLFPNPSASQINISGIDSDGITEARIINTQGSTVMKLRTNITNNHSIDISNLEEGIYFINVTTSKGDIFTEQIVKI